MNEIPNLITGNPLPISAVDYASELPASLALIGNLPKLHRDEPEGWKKLPDHSVARCETFVFLSMEAKSPELTKDVIEYLQAIEAEWVFHKAAYKSPFWKGFDFCSEDDQILKVLRKVLVPEGFTIAPTNMAAVIMGKATKLKMVHIEDGSAYPKD